MVREFSYTSNSGTKDRKVFVIRETESYIEGLDLSLLEEDSVNTILSTYKDFVPVTDKDTKVVLDNYNTAWNRAYRHYSKNKIKYPI